MAIQQIKCYISSKLEHAHKLAALRYDGFHINARWIEMADSGRRRHKPVSHWKEENRIDIETAHFFLLYVEPSDDLKGSIEEVGYAIAHHKKIWIAGAAPIKKGEEQDYSEPTWGVLVKPQGVETELRVPHKMLMPWAFEAAKIRMVPNMTIAFSEMRAFADQAKLLDSNGNAIPGFEF